MTGVDIRPLTTERWADLERLFGPRGAFGGCWCMFNRCTGREFEAGQGEPNRLALRALVDEGRVPGLLAYRDGEPVGWVSVAPRADPDIYAWQGLATMFRAAGFEEVARRKEGRPIMRKKVGS